MSTYYVKTKGTTLATSGRAEVGSDNTNVTGWLKTDEAIYCVAIGQDGRDPPAAVLRLEWKGGSQADFTALAATGEVKYTTGTDLSDTNAVASGEAIVAVANMTWQDGEEIEDGVSASINLGSDYYSELQFGISFADATAGATYEFQLYNVTASAVVAVESGSMITITTAAGASVPTLTTSNCDTITATTARGNGEITNTGGANATRRGFCYKAGTSGDPTTADSVVYDDGSFGAETFSKTITGLSASTGYRVRAYAVNTAGTGYGTTVQLTTIAQRTLACASGSLTLAGTAVTLKATRTLAVEAGAITLSGTAVALSRTWRLAVDAGAITLAGTATGLLYGRKFAIESGVITLSGTAVVLKKGYPMAAASGAFTLTGSVGDPYEAMLDSFLLDTDYLLGLSAMSLLYNRKFAVDSGSITLAGTDVALNKGSKTIDAYSGTLTFAGSDVVLKVGRALACASGSLALSGTAVTLKATRLLAVASGSLSLSGTAVGTYYGRKIQATTGAITLSGTAVNLYFNRKIQATTGALTLAGTAVGLYYGRKIQATNGALTLSGTAVGAYYGRKIQATTGALTLAGTAVNLYFGRKIQAVSGALTLAGTDVILNKGHLMAADSGSITLAGTAVVLKATRKLATTSGAITLSGQALLFPLTRRIEAASGAIVLSGTAISMARGYAFPISSGSFYFDGTDVIMRCITTRTRASGKTLRERSPYAETAAAHEREQATPRSVHQRG